MQDKVEKPDFSTGILIELKNEIDELVTAHEQGRGMNVLRNTVLQQPTNHIVASPSAHQACAARQK